LFYFALYKRIKSIAKKEIVAEYYTLSGGLLLLILFSLSGFQLPFYTNVIFPLFAIVLAPYCAMPLAGVEAKLRLISQWIYIALFPIAILVINYFLKPDSSLLFNVGCILLFGLILLIVTQIKHLPQKVFMLSCAVSLFANFYLNTVLYNEVAAYNGQITAAKYINQSQLADTPVYSVKMQNNVFQFYCNRSVGYIALEKVGIDETPTDALFYVNQSSLDYLAQNKIAFKIVKAFTNYPQEQVLPDFLNKLNRNKVLDKVYLITK
jgi:hypothetical protein